VRRRGPIAEVVHRTTMGTVPAKSCGRDFAVDRNRVPAGDAAHRNGQRRNYLPHSAVAVRELSVAQPE